VATRITAALAIGLAVLVIISWCFAWVDHRLIWFRLSYSSNAIAVASRPPLRLRPAIVAMRIVALEGG
jgi:hypothetical protein